MYQYIRSIDINLRIVQQESVYCTRLKMFQSKMSRRSTEHYNFKVVDCKLRTNHTRSNTKYVNCMEWVFKKSWMDAVQSKTECENTTATANEHKSSELTKFMFVCVPPQYICFHTNTSLLVCVEEGRHMFFYFFYLKKMSRHDNIYFTHAHDLTRQACACREKNRFVTCFPLFTLPLDWSIQTQTHTRTIYKRKERDAATKKEARTVHLKR